MPAAHLCSEQNDGVDHHVAIPAVAVMSRRSMLSTCAAVMLPALTASLPSHAAGGNIAAMQLTQAPARIESWPSIASLEPIYEFKLSVDAIAAGVQDRDKWAFIQKRLESFFGGFIVNEKNYFMGK